jgi:hypothetical protein
VQNIFNDERLEYVELEVTAGTPDCHCDLITEYLCAHHGHGLALCRVDLTRHNGAAGLVLGETELAEAASGTRAKESNVISDLEEGGSDCVESAVKENKGVLGGEGLELV